MALWLTLQTATLAIGAARIPLWARAGFQTQQLALPEMLAVQFVSTALLFPLLLRNANSAAIAFSALPFLQLSAVLSSTPKMAAVGVSIHILLWIGGLWAWTNLLQNRFFLLIARLLCVMLVAGVPLLRYLMQEFSDQNVFGVVPWDPMSAALRQASAARLSAPLGTCSVIFFSMGVIALAINRRRNSFATSYPQSLPQSSH